MTRHRVRTKTTIPEMDFDCVKCGACCVTYGLVEVVASDPTPRTMVTDIEPGTHPDLTDAEIEDQDLRCMKRSCGNRCIALTGHVGKEIGCDIYEKRPAICHAYEKGSVACLQARTVVAFYLDNPATLKRHPELFDPRIKKWRK